MMGFEMQQDDTLSLTNIVLNSLANIGNMVTDN